MSGWVFSLGFSARLVAQPDADFLSDCISCNFDCTLLIRSGQGLLYSNRGHLPGKYRKCMSGWVFPLRLSARQGGPGGPGLFERLHSLQFCSHSFGTISRGSVIPKPRTLARNIRKKHVLVVMHRKPARPQSAIGSYISSADPPPRYLPLIVHFSPTRSYHPRSPSPPCPRTRGLPYRPCRRFLPRIRIVVVPGRPPYRTHGRAGARGSCG